MSDFDRYEWPGRTPPGHIRIMARGSCDYCDNKMEFAGATPDSNGWYIRACKQHKNKAQKKLDEIMEKAE